MVRCASRTNTGPKQFLVVVSACPDNFDHLSTWMLRCWPSPDCSVVSCAAGGRRSRRIRKTQRRLHSWFKVRLAQFTVGLSAGSHDPANVESEESTKRCNACCIVSFTRAQVGCNFQAQQVGSRHAMVSPSCHQSSRPRPRQDEITCQSLLVK